MRSLYAMNVEHSSVEKPRVREPYATEKFFYSARSAAICIRTHDAEQSRHFFLLSSPVQVSLGLMTL